MDPRNLDIQYTQGLWFTNNNSAIKVNKETLLAMACLKCTVATVPLYSIDALKVEGLLCLQGEEGKTERGTLLSKLHVWYSVTTYP